MKATYFSLFIIGSLTVILFLKFSKDSLKDDSQAPSSETGSIVSIQTQVPDIAEKIPIHHKSNSVVVEDSIQQVSATKLSENLGITDRKKFFSSQNLAPRWALGFNENRSKSMNQMGSGELINSLVNIIEIARSEIRGYPERRVLPPYVHDNSTMTQVLLGNNPAGLKFIDEKAEFLNENTEIVDQWELPLFFHFIDKKTVEIRSAGPDLQIWTEDDLVASTSKLFPSYQ